MKNLTEANNFKAKGPAASSVSNIPKYFTSTDRLDHIASVIIGELESGESGNAPMSSYIDKRMGDLDWEEDVDIDRPLKRVLGGFSVDEDEYARTADRAYNGGKRYIQGKIRDWKASKRSCPPPSHS